MRIEVDPKAPTPPSEQIADQVRFAVAGGRIAPGERLPSVRGLAAQALVNPNTVARAYRELEREGTVETRRGSGVFIAEGALKLCRIGTRQLLGERLGRAVEEALAAGLTPQEIEELVARLLRGAMQEVAR
jgi:GntR family transcriptional regulator